MGFSPNCPIFIHPKEFSMEKVLIYGTQACPYCQRAKELFRRKGVAFEEVDLTHDPGKRAEISEQTGWQTVPMIFIGGAFAGGYDDVRRLDEEGRLDAMLGLG
jgi:glutaredoxin 3